MDMNKILSSLTNMKSVMGICALIIIILQNMGIQIDNDSITNVIYGICSILVILGIMNKEGMETTEFNK